jgi:hypothetical protein
MTGDEGQLPRHHPSTGKTKGPTPKSRPPPDLHVCQISDVVICHPLYIEPEHGQDRCDLRYPDSGGRIQQRSSARG